MGALRHGRRRIVADPADHPAVGLVGQRSRVEALKAGRKGNPEMSRRLVGSPKGLLMKTFKLAFLLPLAFVAFACSQSRDTGSTSPSGSTVIAGVSSPLGAQAGNTALAATMQFGQPDVGSPFPPSADHDQSAHAKDNLVPRTVVIDRGGTVTFEVPAGVHQIAIYEPGTEPEDIDTAVLIPLCPGTTPRVIDDATNRVALITHACGSDWQAQYTFDTPGRYLVICAFQVGMYGWVEVRDRD